MERHLRQSALAFLCLLIALSNLSGFGRIIGGMDALSAGQSEYTNPDAQLVETAIAGNQQAFSELYQRHAGWLLPVLWRMSGGDNGKAEELLQEAFVQAWRKLDQLRDPASFGGWLKQLAINLALADRRRMKVVGDDHALPHLADIEPPWPATDLDLERAIAGLPERARQVLVLFCLEGYSHEEIARTLNIEPGTSKGQLHRARNLLKEVLS